MIQLSEHLKDKIHYGFTVNKTRSNKIILFDLDDTIIHTTAEIMIMQDGKIVRKISNKEFNNYTLKANETFNFGEFEDPNILAREEFTKYWKTLKTEYNKGTHIGILTARGNCQMIKQFFANNGIRIKDELIIAINDPELGLKGSIQDKKAEAISILAKGGYNLFIFFDDNEPNLRAAKKLEKAYNIKVQTVKV
jgi:FMN phosphatase YigB (HAD superfamily)